MPTYEKSFKEEAVRLSDDIGVKQAAAQLGIAYIIWIYRLTSAPKPDELSTISAEIEQRDRAVVPERRYGLFTVDTDIHCW